MPHVMKSERGSPEEASDEFNENSNDRSNGHLACLVCGDVSTGRHYGAIACNGCKGFFRRTIRRAYKYSCRFSGNCQIDKHNRAVCRSCRFNRCIQYGMKIDAVQNERDLIGKRPRAHSNSFSHPHSASTNGNISPPQSIGPASVSPINSTVGSAPNSHFYGMDSQSQMVNESNIMSNSRRSSVVNINNINNSTDPWDNPKPLLDLLMKSEEKIKSLRESVVKETGKFEYTTKHEPHNINNGRKATHNDILHSLHSQLLLVIEWAKTLKPFAELGTEDQTALLKNFASQHIVLCVAYRSINASDFLQLINDTCIPRANIGAGDEPGDDFYRKDCERVMDQLVAPMRFLQLDDQEFVALKACVLFNPVARGLSNENVMKVLDTRRRIFAALEHYIRTKNPVDTNRVGDLSFFILSPLQSLAKSISEDVLVTKLSGMAHIDMLMDELILVEDSEPKAHKNSIDLRRSLSENEQMSRPSETCSQQQPQESLTTLRTMQIPITNPPQNVVMPGSAPAQYNLDPTMSNMSTMQSMPVMSNMSTMQSMPAMSNISNMPTMSNVSNISNMQSMPTTSANINTTELSPINYDMMSTLSSYVFGGTLQSPLSPSNDVLFSSAATIPTESKLSNCSTSLDPISTAQQQQQWSNGQQINSYEYTTYQPTVTSNPPMYTNQAAPINY